MRQSAPQYRWTSNIFVRLLLISLFLSTPSALFTPVESAERRCEWVTPPDTIITYSEWHEVPPLFNFIRVFVRKCCVRHHGELIWLTTVFLRTCSPSEGNVVGDDPPGSAEGFAYTYSETIVDQEQGIDTLRTYRTQTRLRWSTPPPPDALRMPNGARSSSSIPDTTVVMSMYTHEDLRNEFSDAQATFDGVLFPYLSTIRMDDYALGLHNHTVVSDAAGINPVDSLVIDIDLLESYTLECIADTIVVAPMSIVRFTNYSPDSMFVEFEATPLLSGLEVELLNNQRVVQSGESVDLRVEFYTAPGYVMVPGQEISALVEAFEGDPSGTLLASKTAIAYAHGGPPVGVGDQVPPLQMTLGQNVPNPFSRETTIPFQLPSDMDVKLVIYDVMGRHVRTIEGRFSASDRRGIAWDGRDARGRLVPSGVYFYSLKAGKNSLVRKAVLLK